MASEEGARLSLWLLQIAWWLAVTLPLAAAGVLAALGVRALNRQARSIERQQTPTGPGGFLQLVRDRWAHQALGQAMVLVVVGGLAAGGLIGFALQLVIRPGVRAAFDAANLPASGDAPPAGEGSSLDLLFLLALLAGAVTLGLGIHSYRSLCRRAAGKAASRSASSARASLLVRWFHDSKAIGLIAVAIATTVGFGLIMQVVSFILLVIPLPSTVSAPAATSAATWFVVVAGAAVLAVPFIALIWLGVRQHKLDVRHYRENPTYRLYVNVTSAFGAGAFSALLLVNLLARLEVGPGNDWVSQLIGGVWVAGYLLAYLTAILLQILYRRWRGQRFDWWNIAAAVLFAIPGSVPAAYLLFLPVARWLARLPGHP